MNRRVRAGVLLIGLVLFLAADPGAAQTRGPKKLPDGAPIVLRGTIITPEGVIRHGYVAILNGQIASVSDERPDLLDAVTVNTHGIILPGFVDVHNHVPFNMLPRWMPGRLFTNRNQWRVDPEYIRVIAEPFNRLVPQHFCDMNAWGELRALVGGTTSTMVTQPQPCIHGLVRNLDFNSGFYGTTELDREHVFNVLELPPASAPAARAAFVSAARFLITNPFFEALFIHLAEGTDAAAEEEFTFVESQSLLNPKGVIIHGISLGATDFQAMTLNGTALVWSPRSNLNLYGQTTNLLAALDAGVDIALGRDWAVTGSSNMLDELKVAARWNREQLGRRLTDQQLVEMVTSAPARIAGVDDQVGAISAGLRADILVIDGDHNDPYRRIIDATPADVQLVFIGGVPLYGDRRFMEHFWERSDLEEINLPEAPKTLATPAATVVVADVETRLRLALEGEGTALAPLTEPEVPPDQGSISSARGSCAGTAHIARRRAMKEESRPYQERFPVGSVVRVADRVTLQRFAREWRFHHPLEPERFRFAGAIAEVAEVGFLPRRSCSVRLEGILGQWHEACLESGENQCRGRHHASADPLRLPLSFKPLGARVTERRTKKKDGFAHARTRRSLRQHVRPLHRARSRHHPKGDFWCGYRPEQLADG